MNERPVALPPDAPSDPHGVLKVFGVLLIVAGAACFGLFAIVLAALLLAPMAAAGEPLEARMVVPSSLFYLALGVALIALGVGSWKVRRWARPLILIVGWTWLIGGILGAVTAIVVVPNVLSAYTGNSASGTAGCVVAMMLAMFAAMLALPIGLIAYYRRPSVAALFDARDPGPSWTDRTPPVLLGVAVLMWVGALACLAGMFAYGALPMFGRIVEGWPLRAVYLVLAVLSAWIGWAVYRRQMAGFWALVALQVVGIVNLFTMRGLDERSLFQAMGYREAEAEQMSKMGLFSNTTFLIVMAGCWLILTVALFAIRKHFLSSASDRPAAPPPV
jgi:hypothetical protein